MITFNGINGNFDINPDEVFYFIKEGTSLLLYLSSQGTVTIAFNNEYDVNSAFRVLLTILHKTIASIPSATSTVYNLNCKFILTHTKSTATITVNFPGKTIAIVCVNSTEATNHNTYLAFVFYSAHIVKNLKSRTLAYVDPKFTEDIPNRLFNSITSAITNSTGGVTIIVNTGVYEESIHCEGDIDIYFKPGAIVQYSGVDPAGISLISFGNLADVRVLGYLTLKYLTHSDPASAFCIRTGSVGNAYIEFDKIEVTGDEVIPIFHNNNCKIFIKGRELNVHNCTVNESISYKDESDLLDIDILKIIVNKGRLLSAAPDDLPNLTLRNILGEIKASDSSGILAFAEGSFPQYNINILNCTFSSLHSAVNTSGLYFLLQGSSVCRIWDINIISKSFSIVQLGGTLTFEVYNNCYGLKTTSGVTLTGSGNFSVNSNLTVAD